MNDDEKILVSNLYVGNFYLGNTRDLGDSRDGELIGHIINYGWEGMGSNPTAIYGEIARVWRACRNTRIISQVNDITGIRYFEWGGYASFGRELQRPPKRQPLPTLDELARDKRFFGSWVTNCGYVYEFSADGFMNRYFPGSCDILSGRWGIKGNVLTHAFFTFSGVQGKIEYEFEFIDNNILRVFSKIFDDHTLYRTKDGDGNDVQPPWPQ